MANPQLAEFLDISIAGVPLSLACSHPFFCGKDFSTSQQSILNNVSLGATNTFVGNDLKFGQLLMDKERRGVFIFAETVSAVRFLQPEISRDLRLGKISNGKTLSESQLLCKYKDASDR